LENNGANFNETNLNNNNSINPNENNGSNSNINSYQLPPSTSLTNINPSNPPNTLISSQFLPVRPTYQIPPASINLPNSYMIPPTLISHQNN
jgi:hypothetical protein